MVQLITGFAIIHVTLKERQKRGVNNVDKTPETFMNFTCKTVCNYKIIPNVYITHYCLVKGVSGIQCFHFEHFRTTYLDDLGDVGT